MTVAESPRKPNIIVIISDDCGYHDFSMHGGETPTPRIDSIGKRGVRFTNGYVSGVVCSPSRAGLLTGRYQQRFGHEYNIPPSYSTVNGLPLSETMLPAVLKQAGYRTIAMGKWHLGYAPKFHPLERGFTDYYGFLQGSRTYWPKDKTTRLNHFWRNREKIKDADFNYLTDHLGDEAAKYIADTKDRPFFLYLAFTATHGPLQALASDLKAANGQKVPAMTLALDRAVGKILDALDEHGQMNNTLLVFINDNGGTKAHDNRPLRGHKGSCWEGGMRVPFVMQWPAKLPPGKVVDDPVISLDIFPTAMHAAGIDQSPGKPLDGVDLTPYLTGTKSGKPHQTLYWKNGRAWAVRDGDLKLLVADKREPTEPMLFNLADDIAEEHDLSGKRPEDAARLKKMYETWRATHQPTPWANSSKNPENQ